jgi:hypothetical protein
MLVTQLHSVGEALDLLKRVELMENQNPFHDTANNARIRHQNANESEPPRPAYDRNRAQRQVQQVHRYNTQGRTQRYDQKGDIVTQEEMKIRAMRNRGALNLEICQIKDEEQIVEESVYRK